MLVKQVRSLTNTTKMRDCIHDQNKIRLLWKRYIYKRRIMCAGLSQMAEIGFKVAAVVKSYLCGHRAWISHRLNNVSGDSSRQCKICDVKLFLQTMVSCRIAMVMMQYSIMANSYWLLVEGIYLHNLLVITVFTERNYFKIYQCIGWGELAWICEVISQGVQVNYVLYDTFWIEPNEVRAYKLSSANWLFCI